MSHTPTPWITDTHWIRATSFDGGGTLAEVFCGQGQAPDNARHIVKCVNAHDELVRDQLAKAAVIVRLHKQRDELMTALTQARETLKGYDHVPSVESTLRMIRAALAKVKS